MNVREDKEVDRTYGSRDRPLPKGLLERWKFVTRSHFVIGYSVIRTEPVGVCDHRRSKSETRSTTVTVAMLVFLCFMSYVTVFVITL